MGVHIRLKSRLEIGDDASSIINLGYRIRTITVIVGNRKQSNNREKGHS